MKTVSLILLVCSLFILVLTENTEDKPSPNADIICPDAVSICPATSTCCIGADGDYSCCPIQSAICCSDHIHCCPQHYKCDLKIFKCDRSFLSTKLTGQKPALKKSLTT